MILKIKYENGWIFYDQFIKIRYEYKEDIVKWDDKLYDVVWNDQETEGCTKYVSIVGRLKNGNEFSIASYGTTYLLNDEGKTIERIN